MNSEANSLEYIVFEGNIGAGKTSIAKRYASDQNASLILEQFEENSFLKLFYKHPERHALPLELWFMAERYKQMEDYFSKGDLFGTGVVSDYIFSKTLLFAKNNLNDNEFLLFTKLFHLLKLQLPKPNLIVYLHRPIHVLLAQIEKRGRSYEKDIDANYLKGIQNQYDRFFQSSSDLKILYINLSDKDLLNNEKDYLRLQKLISEPFKERMKVIQI